MYKCKECGAEYEIKPDYCDCGNDEFIEAVQTENSDTEPVKQMPPKNDDKPKAQPASANSFNNTNYNNNYKRTIPFDSRAVGIFALCIILSLYVLFFAWNNLITQDTQTKEKKAENNKNIPSVEQIWNNAVPKVQKQEVKTEDKTDNLIKQIIPVQTQKKNVPVKKTQNSQPKVTKVQLKKVTTNKPVTQTNKITTQKPVQTVNTAEQAAKQKAEQERLAAEAAQLKKLKEEQAKKVAEQKAKQAAAAKQELTAYKANLRNTLGRKIDFTKVIGDGSCTVSFKIDSKGRLINRSFAKQSSNNTLNDAVYQAIMSTPIFNPPPASYNDEFLNLNIRFYNGNFEISLP